MLARLYLRASTDDQDASRARRQVESFAAERGLVVAGVYIENASGASLARPELFRLIRDSKPGDVLARRADRSTEPPIGRRLAAAAERRCPTNSGCRLSTFRHPG